jgi:hypothetical protein
LKIEKKSFWMVLEESNITAKSSSTLIMRRRRQKRRSLFNAEKNVTREYFRLTFMFLLQLELLSFFSEEEGGRNNMKRTH